jgi:hypothetical protein
MTEPDEIPADEADAKPVQTDNGVYPEDGPQDVSQSADLDYSAVDLDGDGVPDEAAQ